MKHKAVLLTLVLMLVLTVTTGCASSDAPDETSETSASTPIALPEHTLTLDEVREMSMSVSDKSEMATGFPTPLPVIDGTVLAVEQLPVEGGGEWFYAIETTESPETVLEWYSRAYPIANWQVTSAYEVTRNDSTVTTLEMTKGDASSRVTIQSTDVGTLVEVHIAIGSEGAVTL